MPVEPPLQMVFVEVVPAGLGLTVTVIVDELPTQVPAVAVTMYCTVPVALLLGLVRV
jgi:hypothetical protein